jgi:hypothetical protein
MEASGLQLQYTVYINFACVKMCLTSKLQKHFLHILPRQDSVFKITNSVPLC